MLPIIGAFFISILLYILVEYILVVNRPILNDITIAPDSLYAQTIGLVNDIIRLFTWAWVGIYFILRLLWKYWYIILLIMIPLFIFGFMATTNTHELGTAFDEFYDIILKPSFDFFKILFDASLDFLETLLCWHNVWVGFLKTFTVSGINILRTCSNIQYSDLIKNIVIFFLEVFKSIAEWIITFFTNPLDVYTPAQAMFNILIPIQSIFNCLCPMFGVIWEIFIGIFIDENLSWYIHHFINVPLALLYTIIDTIFTILNVILNFFILNFDPFFEFIDDPERPPYLIPTLQHIIDANTYFGIWVDNIMELIISILFDYLPIDILIPNLSIKAISISDLWPPIGSLFFGFGKIPPIALVGSIDAFFHADMIIRGKYQDGMHIYIDIFITELRLWATNISEILPDISIISDFSCNLASSLYFLIDIIEFILRILINTWGSFLRDIFPFFFTPDGLHPIERILDERIMDIVNIAEDDIETSNQCLLNIANTIGTQPSAYMSNEFSHILIQTIWFFVNTTRAIPDIEAYIISPEYLNNMNNLVIEIRELGIAFTTYFAAGSLQPCPTQTPHDIFNSSIYDPISTLIRIAYPDVLCSIGYSIDSLLKTIASSIITINEIFIVTVSNIPPTFPEKMSYLFAIGQKGNINTLIIKDLDNFAFYLANIIVSPFGYINKINPNDQMQCPIRVDNYINPTTYHAYDVLRYGIHSLIRLFSLSIPNYIGLIQDVIERITGTGTIGACRSISSATDVTDCMCYTFEKGYDFTIGEFSHYLISMFLIGDCAFSSTVPFIADEFYNLAYYTSDIVNRFRSLICELFTLIGNLIDILIQIIDDGLINTILDLIYDGLMFIIQELLDIFLDPILDGFQAFTSIIQYLIQGIICLVDNLGEFYDIIVDLFGIPTYSVHIVITKDPVFGATIEYDMHLPGNRDKILIYPTSTSTIILPPIIEPEPSCYLYDIHHWFPFCMLCCPTCFFTCTAEQSCISTAPIGIGDFSCITDWITDFFDCIDTNVFCASKTAMAQSASLIAGHSICTPTGLFGTCESHFDPPHNTHKCHCYQEDAIPAKWLSIPAITAPPAPSGFTYRFSTDGYNYTYICGGSSSYHSICKAYIYDSITFKPISINSAYSACCFSTGETMCRISTLNQCNGLGGRWIDGAVCDDHVCIGDCEYNFIVLPAEIQNESFKRMYYDTNENIICGRQYYNLMNVTEDSYLYDVLLNDYEKCVFSYNLTRPLNMFSFIPNTTLIDPEIFYRPSKMWATFQDVGKTMIYTWIYMWSNMTTSEYILMLDTIPDSPDIAIYTAVIARILKDSIPNIIKNLPSLGIDIIGLLTSSIRGTYDISGYLYANYSLQIDINGTNYTRFDILKMAFKMMLYDLNTAIEKEFNSDLYMIISSLELKLLSMKSNPIQIWDPYAVPLLKSAIYERYYWNRYLDRDPELEPIITGRGTHYDHVRWNSLKKREVYAETELEAQHWRNERMRIFPYMFDGPQIISSNFSTKYAFVETNCQESRKCYDRLGRESGVCGETDTAIKKCECSYIVIWGACCLSNGDCINTSNPSDCYINNSGVGFHIGSTCDILNGTDFTICVSDTELYYSNISACCIGDLRYDFFSCQMITQEECDSGGGSWYQNHSCDEENNLDWMCGHCSSLYFPRYEVTGNFLCLDAELEFINNGGKVSDASCDERTCWDWSGNDIGVCTTTDNALDGWGSLIPPYLLTQSCICVNNTIDTYACCGMYNNDTCIEYTHISNMSECILANGTFKAEMTCSQCFILDMDPTTYGACCYKDGFGSHCEVVNNELECLGIHATGIFNLGILCDSRFLAGECDHCSSEGCRQCPYIVELLNIWVDMFFHCINIGLDYDIVSSYSPIRYIDPLHIKKLVVLDPISEFILDAIEYILNIIIQFFANSFGYDVNYINIRDFIDSMVLFFTDWSDPYDPGTIYYWYRFFSGLNPIKFFGECDPLKDVLENRGNGVGIVWGLVITIGIFAFLGVIFVVILKGTLNWIFYFLIGWAFFKLWMAFSYAIPIACVRVMPVIFLGIYWWHITSIGFLVITFPVYIPIIYPIATIPVIYQFIPRIVIDLLPFAIHIPMDIPRDIHNVISSALNLNFKLCPTFICPDCLLPPYYFTDIRGIFYILKWLFPRLYCATVGSDWILTSWIHNIPWLIQKLTFPGLTCDDSSIIRSDEWIFCFKMNILTTIFWILILIPVIILFFGAIIAFIVLLIFIFRLLVILFYLLIMIPFYFAIGGILYDRQWINDKMEALYEKDGIKAGVRFIKSTAHRFGPKVKKQ